jgi:hypothetical protein
MSDALERASELVGDEPRLAQLDHHRLASALPGSFRNPDLLKEGTHKTRSPQNPARLSVRVAAVSGWMGRPRQEINFSVDDKRALGAPSTRKRKRGDLLARRLLVVPCGRR